jgi:hypothetical protein
VLSAACLTLTVTELKGVVPPLAFVRIGGVALGGLIVFAFCRFVRFFSGRFFPNNSKTFFATIALPPNVFSVDSSAFRRYALHFHASERRNHFRPLEMPVSMISVQTRP